MSSIQQPTRRGFLLGLLAAPVIVKASSLMAVKPVADYGFTEYSIGFLIEHVPVGKPTKLIVPGYLTEYAQRLLSNAREVAYQNTLTYP